MSQAQRNAAQAVRAAEQAAVASSNSNPPSSLPPPALSRRYYNPPPAGSVYPPQSAYLLHGPPGLIGQTPNLPPPSSSARVAPPPLPPPAPHYLYPPTSNLGLSSLAAAADSKQQAADNTTHPKPAFLSSSGQRDRSRSASPNRGAGSGHHQLSLKRRQAQRAEHAQKVSAFWKKTMEAIDKTDFKKLKHELPLARIKKIMKADSDVRMISAEAPILFAKVCELFILDLTLRAWGHTQDTNRRTLQRSDLCEAISESECFDFLADIVPREEIPEEGNATNSDEPKIISSKDVELTTDSLIQVMRDSQANQIQQNRSKLNTETGEDGAPLLKRIKLENEATGQE